MTQSPMQCSFCGSDLPAAANFCKDCGKSQSQLPPLHEPSDVPIVASPNREAGQRQPTPAEARKQEMRNSALEIPLKRKTSLMLSQFNQSAQNRASRQAPQTGKPSAAQSQTPAPNQAWQNAYALTPPTASLPTSLQPPFAPVTYAAPRYGGNREVKRGLAIASLVIGVVSLVFSLVVVGGVFAIVGAILGIMALVKASNEPMIYGGTGLAKGGIASSGFAVVFAVLILFIALPKISGYRMSGATWQRYEIGDNLLSVELPGAPKKLETPQFDNLPPDVRDNITLTELQQCQYNDFVVTMLVLGYNEKMEYDNQAGVNGMMAQLKNRPEVKDVQYSTSVIGDSMLSITGSMTVKGKPTVISGFIENHGRKAYTVMTFYLQSNKDAPAATKRVFESIALN